LVAVTLSADQRINPRAARASRERLWTRAYVKNLSPEKAAELAALEYDNNNTPAGLDQEATVITIAARPRTLPTSDAEALFAGLENVEKMVNIAENSDRVISQPVVLDLDGLAEEVRCHHPQLCGRDLIGASLRKPKTGLRLLPQDRNATSAPPSALSMRQETPREVNGRLTAHRGDGAGTLLVPIPLGGTRLSSRRQITSHATPI
jgi:hypothetical protein